MSSLDSWIEKQGRAAERHVGIENALLGNAKTAYVWYRMRFIALRYGLFAIVHVLELLVLIELFQHRGLTGVLLLSSISSLLVHAWWGALESFRESVRESISIGEARHVHLLIGRWLTASRFVSLLAVLFLLLVAISVSRIDGLPWGQYHWFMTLAYSVRMALQIYVQSYHSSVFAIRRIFRPFLSFFAVDVIMLGGFCLTWSFFSPSALAIVLLFAAVVQAVVAIHFVRKMSFQLGWAPPVCPKLTLEVLRSTVLRSELLQSAFSSALMGIDSLFIIVLFLLDQGQGRLQPLILLFFVASPAFRLSHDWIRVFYFDLKRADVELFPNLKKRFERSLLGTSGFVAVLSWLIAATCLGLISEFSSFLLIPLFFLFILRSLLAFWQMKWFTETRYPSLMFSGALVLLSTVLVGVTYSDMPVAILFLVLGLSVAIILPSVYDRYISSSPESGVVTPGAWLDILVSQERPVRILKLFLSPDCSETVLREISTYVKRKCSSSTVLCQVRLDSLLIFQSAEQFPELSTEELLRRYPKSVEQLRVLTEGLSGAESLRELQNKKELFVFNDDVTSAQVTLTLDEDFLENFPQGICLEVDGEGEVRGVNALDRKALRAIYLGARKFARSLILHTESTEYLVAALADSKGLQRMYAILASGDREQRKRFMLWSKKVSVTLGENAMARAQSSTPLPLQ